MILIITKKATKVELDKMAYEFGRYIKVVADIEKEILAGGAGMHFEEEALLLEYGCKQSSLWGGGIDLESGIIDYDSMINIRPNQDNPSRTIASNEIRHKFDMVVKKRLL